MSFEEIIAEILKEKAAATNKEKMGALLDQALVHLKEAASLTEDQKTSLLIGNHSDALKAKDAEIQALKQELTEAHEIAEDALAKFNETISKLPPSLEVTVNGQDMVVNHGVNFKGIEYSAQDLAKDVEVLKALVEIGSGAVTKKEGK